MNDAEVIVALGDIAGVSSLLGVPYSTVANWKSRGIPWQMRPLVKAQARRKRIALPDSFLTQKRAFYDQSKTGE